MWDARPQPPFVSHTIKHMTPPPPPRNLDVQMAKAKAQSGQSAATWSGTELVCAAVQRGKTPKYVVMTMCL